MHYDVVLSMLQGKWWKTCCSSSYWCACAADVIANVQALQRYTRMCRPRNLQHHTASSQALITWEGAQKHYTARVTALSLLTFHSCAYRNCNAVQHDSLICNTKFCPTASYPVSFQISAWSAASLWHSQSNCPSCCLGHEAPAFHLVIAAIQGHSLATD
jgi:hypothetical protein